MLNVRIQTRLETQISKVSHSANKYAELSPSNSTQSLLARMYRSQVSVQGNPQSWRFTPTICSQLTDRVKHYSTRLSSSHNVPLTVSTLVTSKRNFSEMRVENNDKYGFIIVGYIKDEQSRKRTLSALKDLGLKFITEPKKGWVCPNPQQQNETKLLVETLLKNPPEEMQAPASTIQTKTNDSSFEKFVDNFLAKHNSQLTNLLATGNPTTFFANLKSALIFHESFVKKSSDAALQKACGMCAQYGLTPGPEQHVYFSRRSDDIECLLGYKGMIELVRNAYPGLQIESNIVQEGDDFKAEEGDTPKVSLIKHSEPGAPITYAYVLITYPEGGRTLHIIDSEHIAKRKACSPGSRAPSHPWNKFEREMTMKTALKDALRFLRKMPKQDLSNQLNAALEALRLAYDELSKTTQAEQVDLSPENKGNKNA